MKANVGDRVHAARGTKSNWGVVLDYNPTPGWKCYLVEFDDVDYPLTMCTYYIPERDILEVRSK